jgi:hypothetical protein
MVGKALRLGPRHPSAQPFSAVMQARTRACAADPWECPDRVTRSLLGAPGSASASASASLAMYVLVPPNVSTPEALRKPVFRGVMVLMPQVLFALCHRLDSKRKGAAERPN